jgi:hypothetical protein
MGAFNGVGEFVRSRYHTPDEFEDTAKDVTPRANEATYW